MPVPAPNLSGDSPEIVALSLMFLILDVKPVDNKDDLLDLYAECLKAAHGKRPLPSEVGGGATLGM